jgi:hypothetical protein
MTSVITPLVLLFAAGMLEADDLLLEMDKSLEILERPDKAPNVPAWPPDLPDPFTMQPGDVLEGNLPATCYPYPTDFVLEYHLRQWESYPGRCQRKMNALAGQLEDSLAFCHAAIDDLESSCVSDVEEPDPFWDHVILSLGLAGAAVGGIVLGYAIAVATH